MKNILFIIIISHHNYGHLYFIGHLLLFLLYYIVLYYYYFLLYILFCIIIIVIVVSILCCLSLEWSSHTIRSYYNTSWDCHYYSICIMSSIYKTIVDGVNLHYIHAYIYIKCWRVLERWLVNISSYPICNSQLYT